MLKQFIGAAATAAGVLLAIDAGRKAIDNSADWINQNSSGIVNIDISVSDGTAFSKPELINAGIGGLAFLFGINMIGSAAVTRAGIKPKINNRASIDDAEIEYEESLHSFCEALEEYMNKKGKKDTYSNEPLHLISEELAVYDSQVRTSIVNLDLRSAQSAVKRFAHEMAIHLSVYEQSNPKFKAGHLSNIASNLWVAGNRYIFESIQASKLAPEGSEFSDPKM